MAEWTAATISALKARFSGSSMLVDSSQMIAKASTVSSVITDMERTFNELQRVVSRTSGYWVGDAGDHHRRMFNNDKEEITFILTRLKEHPEDLKLMANNYEVSERKLTETNRKLRTDYI